MHVRYGDGTLEFELPDCETAVVEPTGGTPVDVREAANRALSDPHGPPLSEVVDPDDEVAVVVTDVTRSTPDRVLLEAMLDRVPTPRENVTAVVGLGLHRPMTDEELRAGLGEHADLAINHDPGATVEVGHITVPDREGAGGSGDGRPTSPHDEETLPVAVHEAVADADTVLATGMVEPHQYAGFSGGAKTVVVGAGTEQLIRYTHGPDMLSRPGVRLGRIDDNPFRELLDRAGDIAGPDFCCNVTAGPAGILDVEGGRPRAVVRELAAVAREALSAPVPDPGGDDRPGYDVVIAGVGAPKDANLYQASRAATYALLGPHNPLVPGGRIVVPARLTEGYGEGTGERRFREQLKNATDAESLYEQLRGGYEPGAQRAFVLARALREAELWVTNAGMPAPVDSSMIHSEPDVADAVPAGSRVLVVPDGIHTLLSPSSPPNP